MVFLTGGFGLRQLTKMNLKTYRLTVSVDFQETNCWLK